MRALTLAPVPVSKGAARGKIVQSTGQSGWRRLLAAAVSVAGCGSGAHQPTASDSMAMSAMPTPAATPAPTPTPTTVAPEHGPGTGCAARGHDASARARHGETQGSGTSRTATRTARGATQDGRASTATAAGGQLSPAHQQRELLRAGRVLPGYRPRGKRGRPAMARRSSAKTTTAGAGSPSEYYVLRGDVLGGQVRPRRREEHGHVDRLDGEPALDIPPEDGLPEEVDPRQPVPGGQVRLDHRRRVQRH